MVICAGVIKGIERVSKIIMPALFVIFILLAIRSLSLPGSMEGVIFTAAEMASFVGGRYVGYGTWTGIFYGIA